MDKRTVLYIQEKNVKVSFKAAEGKLSMYIGILFYGKT